MVGRPRKIGKRQPNGQLSRAYVNPKAQVAAQPHRMLVMKDCREREEAESAFGRLMLQEKITPAMYEAGKLYADLSAQARRVYSSPPIHPTGIDLMRVSGGGYDGDIPKHVAEAIKRRYNDAFEACGGLKVQRAVKEHVVLEQPVTDMLTLELLKIGLSNLISFFGLDASLQIGKSRS